MGQLVFQATLGGQVNLVGPNTASTFNINVPAVAGNMVTTGDTATVTSAMISGPVSIAKGGTNQTAFTSPASLKKEVLRFLTSSIFEFFDSVGSNRFSVLMIFTTFI